MVLVILALAAAMVVPQAFGTSDLRAQSAAREVMAAIEYAQNQAIVTQTDMTVSFSVSGNSYCVRVYNQSGPVIHPITKKDYEVDFDTAGGFNGVSISAATFGSASDVTFTSLGAPVADGSVDVAAGEHTYRVTVAPVTGRVIVAKIS